MFPPSQERLKELIFDALKGGATQMFDIAPSLAYMCMDAPEAAGTEGAAGASASPGLEQAFAVYGAGSKDLSVTLDDLSALLQRGSVTPPPPPALSARGAVCVLHEARFALDIGLGRDKTRRRYRLMGSMLCTSDHSLARMQAAAVPGSRSSFGGGESDPHAAAALKPLFAKHSSISFSSLATSELGRGLCAAPKTRARFARHLILGVVDQAS